jgi:DivIVA domain-containing protein
MPADHAPLATPDQMSPASVERTTFTERRRGYDQDEVRAFQQRVAGLLRAAEAREAELQAQLDEAANTPLDEGQLAAALGEETARILVTARQAAADIRAKAEDGAATLVQEAQDEAKRARHEADTILEARTAEAEAAALEVRRVADEDVARKLTDAEQRLADAIAEAERIRLEASEEANRVRSDGDLEAAAVLAAAREAGEAEVDEGRRRGREAVAEAQVVRERVLADLARKRKAARIHLEQLRAGRDRLLAAYEVVRRTLAEATGELEGVLGEARQAAGAAARRVEAEGDGPERIEAELAAGRMADLPLFTGVDDEVAETVAAADPSTETAEDSEEEPEADETGPEPIHLPPRRDRRGLFRHRRSDRDHDNLPEGELIPLTPSDPMEEVRVLRDEAERVPGDDLVLTADLDVHELFERIKAEEAAEGETETETETAAPVEAEAEPEAPVEAEPVVEAAPEEAAAEEEPEAAPADDSAAGDDALLARREAVTGDIERRLARQVKRVMADEQNEVLDALRRRSSKGAAITVDELLPEPETHAAHYVEASTGALTEALAGGRAFFGGNGPASAAAVGDLSRELAASTADRVRERLASVIHDANEDDEAMIDGFRACYREWKAQHVDTVTRHMVAAAFARGVFEAVSSDAPVRWLGDDDGPPCPDCEDNVLAGPLGKGEEFPTGHRHPPAHPGCRCLVLPADT